MSALSNPQRREDALILALAFLLRAAVAAISLASGPAWFFHRGLEMGFLGQSLLTGHGLADPFGVPTGPTAFIAPGYPALVALIFRLCGSYSTLSAATLMLINLAANLLTLGLILRLTRRLFGRPAALAAGIFWACSLPLLWMPTIFWETSVSTAILTALITFAVERPALRPRGWLALGCCCALAGLVNPALLPTLTLTAAFVACTSTPRWQLRVKHLALTAFAFALVFAPWPARNARVFHAFIPLRSTVGLELFMGNRPSSDGFYDESIIPAVNPAELAELERLGEVAYNQRKQHLAAVYIRQQPARFVRLTLARTWRFWSGTGSKDASILYALHALTTTSLGFIGLSRIYRHRAWRTFVCFAIPLLLFPLPYLITHAEFRYRLLLDPILTVLAAGALTHLARLLTPRSLPGREQTDSYQLTS